MTKYQVKEGKQRFKPIHLGLWKNKVNLIYKIKFDSSCRYDLKNQNQSDINKLFGLSFFSLNWPIHHYDSARFGWRYNIQSDKIEIFSYCYVDGERLFDEYKPICKCSLNIEYKFLLGISSDNYHFAVFKEDNIFNEGYGRVSFNHNKKWSFPLNTYFGGDEHAPHNMTIYMEKR